MANVNTIVVITSIFSSVNGDKEILVKKIYCDVFETKSIACYGR